MCTYRFLTALLSLALLALPSVCHARGFAKAPEIESTGDIDESALLTVRNGIALTGLLRAALAESTRTVTVVTDDTVVYEVSFDDDGQYTQVLNHGGRPGAEYEVAAAVRAFERDTGYEAVLAGDQDPHVELELDIEGRIGGEVIGIVDVIGGSTGVEMIVVVDPTAIGFDLDWIIQVVLPEIMHGDCSPGGYVGEMCDLLGTKTGCACLDMKDPDTGQSTLDPLCNEDDPDPFDPLYGNNAEQEQAEESAESKNQRKAAEGENDGEGDEGAPPTDPDDIAPWTEGPMLLVDNLGVLVVTQILFGTQQGMDLHHQAQ